MLGFRIIPFLCLLLLASVLHLSAGCPLNEWLVGCGNECNTCELQGECYDCSAPTCDCVPGYSRATNGLCIPTRQCSGSDEVLVQERAMCDSTRCKEDCIKMKFRYGRCTAGLRCKCF